MKTTNKPGGMKTRTIWQLIISVLLITFPLLMIFFNGSRAFQAITWKSDSVLKATEQILQQKDSLMTPTTFKIPRFGIYDPQSRFKGIGNLAFEQLYISWQSVDEPSLKSRLEQIVQNQRIPVLTIEPWSGKNEENSLLSDICKGAYDRNIDQVIHLIGNYSGEIYISWGHEMDQDLTKRYPWSGKDPGQYVLAYQYVREKIRKQLKNEIKWIWSPVGKKGCERYWPGADKVDFVGMPIYSYPAWDKNYYGHIRSFKSWYQEKYALVEQFRKPIAIVEMGVTGSADYQTFWLQEAFESFKLFSSIELVLFFYDKDVEGSWGKEMPTPDWRTDPQVLLGLVDWITKGQ